MAQPPIRPRSLRTRISEAPDEIRLEGRYTAWFIVGFIGLWLTLWTGGCIAIGWNIVHGGDWFLILFAVPFYTAWIAVFGYLVSLLMGREQATLNRAGFEYRSRTFIRWHTRLIPLAEILGFRECIGASDGDGGRQSSYLGVTNLGALQRFCRDVPAVERIWLVWRLQTALTELQRAHREIQAPTPYSGPEEDPVPQAQPPADSRWSCTDDGTALSFHSQGVWSWLSFAALLMVNAFWNGIVVIFLGVLFGFAPGGVNGQAAAPDGWGWWGLFLFLIPFEVVGLALFIALLLEFLEPVRHTVWEFAADQVRRRVTRLGFGRTRYFEVPAYGSTVVRDDLGKSRWTMVNRMANNQEIENDPIYGVLVADSERREICTLHGLSLGEARWVSDKLRRERRSWFIHH